MTSSKGQDWELHPNGLREGAAGTRPPDPLVPEAAGSFRRARMAAVMRLHPGVCVGLSREGPGWGGKSWAHSEGPWTGSAETL